MKKLITLLLALVIVFSGCNHSTPTPETSPVSTETIVPETEGTSIPVVPMETTEPEQTTVAAVPTEPEETTVPTEPEETTVPPETTGFESYTIRIEDPDRLIYAAPGFHQDVTASFEEAGVYTIVEEAYDWDGNLWGRLKSGIGWVCLTEPPIVPIHADFAPEHFAPDYEWHCDETEYVTEIGILANEHITDIQIALLGIDPAYNVEEVLFTLDEMEADQALKLSVVVWGDFTTYGVSFTDAKGNNRTYAMMVSGKDGSLICSEYQQ